MSTQHKNDRLDHAELLNLALYANQNNQPGQAIEHLKALLEKDPENGVALYLLGATHAEIGMYDAAIAEIRTALIHAPELTAARFQLGLLYLTSGLIEQAAETWEELTSLEQTDPYYFFCKGLLDLSNNDFQGCIEKLTKGIKLNQQNAPLNKDMQMMIDEAQKAIDESTRETASNNEDASSSGRHVLLNAYQTQDDDQTH